MGGLLSYTRIEGLKIRIRDESPLGFVSVLYRILDLYKSIVFSPYFFLRSSSLVLYFRHFR